MGSFGDDINAKDMEGVRPDLLVLCWQATEMSGGFGRFGNNECPGRMSIY